MSGKRCFHEENPVIIALYNNLLKWEDLRELVATRIIQEITVQETECDNNENTIYHPMCIQKHRHYHCFCVGWD
jgi:hypothetical protein